AVGAVWAIALAGRSPIGRGRLRRRLALAAATLAMLLGPAIWSLDTPGYAASGTFPAGGPESAQLAGGPGNGPGGGSGRGGLFGFGGAGGFTPGGSAGAPRLGAGGPRGGSVRVVRDPHRLLA